MSSQRSTRKSRGAAKVKVFDEETRRAIKRKQLDALEKDNWQEERRTLAEENDEDYVQMDEDDDSDDGGAVSVNAAKRPKKKEKKKKAKDVWDMSQKCKSLQEILDEEQHYKYPSWVPNYTSIAAAPSRYPARRFCSVSGLQGKYKCRVTGEYLANLAAYGTHRETKLKGMV